MSEVGPAPAPPKPRWDHSRPRQGGRHGTALGEVGPALDRLVRHWTGPKSYHCLLLHHKFAQSSCTAVAGGDRDIDLYHWSTPMFSSVWQDTLSVLVARGRARVSVSASAADWPKRIRDMQYVDHDDFAAAH